MVTTYWPSGETCDMKPTRICEVSFPLTERHSISFFGPSRSIPRVLPSRENEWQLAQVGMLSSNKRLSGSPTLRNLQAISGTAVGASGLMTPFSTSEGISATSR